MTHNRRLMEEHARRLVAERIAERRVARAVGFTIMALSAVIVGLAGYDIANGDFPAVSVFCFCVVATMYLAGRMRLWMLRRRVLSGKM